MRKQLLVALAVMATVMTIGASPAYAAEDKTTVTEKSDDTTVTVKSGDTLTKIAKEHDTTYVRLFNANKKIEHPDMIDVGDKVRVPSEKEKLTDRYSKIAQPVVDSVAAPAVASTATTYTTQQYTDQPVNSSSYYVGNGMWCTDYVHSKRPDVAIYGNAGMSWIGSAQAAGKSTGSAPKAGAVAVTNGHVAYVEKVNSDGSYVVSEMGWNYQAGQYNKRTVQPGAFGGFIY